MLTSGMLDESEADNPDETKTSFDARGFLDKLQRSRTRSLLQLSGKSQTETVHSVFRTLALEPDTAHFVLNDIPGRFHTGKIKEKATWLARVSITGIHRLFWHKSTR